MSSNVDERIVRMEFDNDKFEKNAKESMSTLDRLKAKLSFKKNKEDINESVNETSFDPIVKGANKIRKSFSALDVFMFTFFNRMSNRIINMGERLVSSLSVDQIFAGWSKFEASTKSIGTLVSQGNDIDVVTNSMKQLLWYTDATSYSYSDMADNISKFTSAGISLDVAMQSMIGINNWAAKAGANVMQANRAMYNLSQAIGVGYIRRQDWISIQNATMDTKEFKEQVIAAAVAQGTLKKTIQGTYVTTEKAAQAGLEVTYKNFADTLTSGQWFSTDILTSTLERYSLTTTLIQQISEKSGKSAEDAMDIFEEAFTSGSDALKEFGINLNEYDRDILQFGLDALKAGQEFRSYSDVLNSIKDEVSTGWLNTFNNIFGNYSDQKKVWSRLYDSFHEIFSAGTNNRNNILEAWIGENGQEALLGIGGELRYVTDENGKILGTIESEQGALFNLLDIIVTIKKTIREAFQTVFGYSTETEDGIKKAGKSLATFTENFRAWSKNALANVQKFMPTFKNIMMAMFSGFRAVGKVVGKIAGIIYKAVAAIWPIISVLGNIASKVLKNIFDSVSNAMDRITSSGLFERIKEFSERLAPKIENVFNVIGGIVLRVWNAIKGIVASVYDWAKENNVLLNLWLTLEKIIISVGHLIKGVAHTMQMLFSKFNAWAEQSPLFEKFKKSLSNFIADLPNKIDRLIGLFAKLGGVLKTLWSFIRPYVEVAKIKTKSFLQGLFGGKDTEKAIDTAEKVSVSALKFTTTFENVSGRIVKTVENTNDAVEKETKNSPIAEFFKSIGYAIQNVIPVLTASFNLLGNLFKFITSVINKISDFIGAIADGERKIEAKQVEQILALTVLTLAIYKLVTTIMNIVRLFGNLGKVLNKLSGYLQAKKFSLYADMIESIAKSIAIITLSIAVLARIASKNDAGQLEAALTAFAAVLLLMTTFIVAITRSLQTVSNTTVSFDKEAKGVRKFLPKIEDTSGDIYAISRILVALGVSVLLVSIAMAKIANISWGDFWKGVIVLGAIIIGMFGLIALTSKYPIKEDTGKVLKSYAKALGKMALVIALFGFIKVSNMETGIKTLIIVTAVFGALIGIISFLTRNVERARVDLNILGPSIQSLSGKGSNTTSNFDKLGDVIESLAKSLTVIMVAIAITSAIMQKVEWDAFAKLATGFAILGGALVGILFILKYLVKGGDKQFVQKVQNLNSVVKSLTFSMTAIMALAYVSKFVEWPSFAKLATGFAILGGALVGILFILKYLVKGGDKQFVQKVQNLNSVVKSLTFSMTAIMALAYVSKFVEWPSFAKLATGFAILGGALVGLIKIIKLIKDKKLNASTIGLLNLISLSLSTSIAAIAAVTYLLKNVDVSSIVKLVSVTAILEIALFCIVRIANMIKKNNISSSSLISLSLILLSLSNSILILSVVARSLGNIKINNILKLVSITTVLEVALLGIVGMISFAKKASVSIVSILLIVGAVVALTFAIGSIVDTAIKLSSVNTGAILKLALILGAMVGSLVLLTAVAYIAGPALLIASVALLAAASSFALVSASINLFVDSLVALQNIQAVKLLNGINATLTALKNGIGALTQIFVIIFTSIGIALMKAFVEMVRNLYSSIRESRTYILGIIQEICIILTEAVPIVGQALVDILIAILDIVIFNMPIIMDRIINLVLALIDGFATAFEQNADRIRDTVLGAMQKMWKSVLKFFGLSDEQADGVLGIFGDLGRKLSDGLIGGIRNSINNVVNVFKSLGSTVIKTVKTLFGIHSPSRVFYGFGDNIVAGLANGISENEKDAVNSISDMGETMKDTMGDAISSISDDINDNMDNSVVIRPVMDLSDVQNGTKELYSMMKDTNGYDISGSVNYADNASNSMSAAKQAAESKSTSNSQTQTTTSDGNIINTFYVTGSNPQEIAEQVADIIQRKIDRRKAKWA